MNLTLSSTWLWLIAIGAVGVYLWWQRRDPQKEQSGPTQAAGPARAGAIDPHVAFQQEILRGILRREGLLPPAPSPSRDTLEWTQRFRLVPLPPPEAELPAGPHTQGEGT